MLTTSVDYGNDVIGRLASAWDSIRLSCSHDIIGIDATCTSAWAKALARSHLKNLDLHTIVVQAESGPVAILPYYQTTRKAFPRARREIRMITEANCGRSGLLVSHDDPSLVVALLDGLRQQIDDWDVFILTVVQGSPSHIALAEATNHLSLPLRVLTAQDSPFIKFGSTWHNVLAGLPKKMRWTIRKSEKDLASMGRLEYENLTNRQSVCQLLDSIHVIERNSWKEQSSSSITRNTREMMFYEALGEIAADSRMLNAHLLSLDRRPIAYILGLTAGDGVFLDLKESFDAEFAQHSPGHVLKRFAIERLIDQGVTHYDFMGRCEPYKMRWTNLTYRRITFAVFNTSVGGWLAHLRSLAGEYLKNRRSVRRPTQHDSVDVTGS